MTTGMFITIVVMWLPFALLGCYFLTGRAEHWFDIVNSKVKPGRPRINTHLFSRCFGIYLIVLIVFAVIVALGALVASPVTMYIFTALLAVWLVVPLTLKFTSKYFREDE